MGIWFPGQRHALFSVYSPNLNTVNALGELKDGRQWVTIRQKERKFFPFSELLW
jgi:hypothetical protein